jgi:uncharacterized protein YkwD
MLAWVAATNTSKGKVMPSSLAQRVRSRTLRGLLFTAVLAQIGLVPMTAQAQAQPDWVVAINNLRTSAGLPAVVADSASTTGAINHSRYVVLNNLLTHTEVSTMPGYTDSGNTAGQTGDVGAGGGLSSFQDSLKGFMTGGYHWEPIMDPSLVSVGYGTATAAEVQALFPSQFKPGGFGSATTIVFNRSFGKPTKPIMWPPSGGTMPYTSYTGGETPNALTNCAGYSTPTGASLTLQLPSAPQVTGVTLSMAGVSGNLPSCWFDGDNVQFTANEKSAGWDTVGKTILTYANAVVIIPQQPLSNGTYCISVTNAGAPINWSFTVGSSPVAAPAPCGSGSGSGSAATTTPVPAAPTATPAASGTGRLAAGQGLNTGDQLFSPNGKTRLIMQTDGNLCLYRMDTGAFLWCSGTSGKGGTHVVMQSDGNFVMYNGNNSAAPWSSSSYGHAGASLVLRDDGNLVVLDANGTQLWASNTAWNTQTSAPTATPVAPTATPVPAAPTATPAAQGTVRLVANQQLVTNQQIVSANGKVRLLMQTDGNLCLYRMDTGAFLWCSGSYGKGVTHVLMQTDGNFVAYNNATVPFWSTGTYGHPGASLVLRDDGNLVLVDANGAQLWATNTSVN